MTGSPGDRGDHRGDRWPRLTAGLWLALIAGTLAVGALAPPALRTAVVEDGPGCPWRALTGVVCPFCGLTHATVALGQGDLAGALSWHPLAPLVLVAMVAICVAIVAGRGDRLLAGRRPLVLLAGTAVVWAVNLAAT